MASAGTRLNAMPVAVLEFEFRDWVNRPARAKCSNVQPEKACNKDNDDDHADDVENIHDVLRLRHARFQMKPRRSNSNVLVYK
jgi:hypothetical protein